LKEAYRNRDEKTFFDLFPHSYAKFIEYYGYVENKPMPLYHEAFEHIKFLTSSKICKQKLLDKLVNIAKDAKWEADAPNFLCEILRSSILECPDTILSLLKDKEIKEINNFWYFILYYPSLNPENDDQYTHMYEQLYRCVNERNKAMGQIIKDVYHKIVVESKCDSLFEVIHKAEKHIPLKSFDVSLLMESYEDASLINNAELEECRSEAIIHIMYDTCNVKTLLYVIKDNTKYCESFVDELQHPVREMNEINKHDHEGFRTGLWIENQGQQTKFCFYQKGTLDGPCWIVSANKKRLYSFGEFSNGEYSGVWYDFGDDGTLLSMQKDFKKTTCEIPQKHKAQGTCPYQCYSISYHPNGHKQSEGILLWDVSPDADSTFEYGEWKYYDKEGKLVQAIIY
jgi:hypothetical protein